MLVQAAVSQVPFATGTLLSHGMREDPCVGGRGLRPGHRELFREQGVHFRRQGLLPGQPDEEEDFVQRSSNALRAVTPMWMFAYSV